MKSKKEVEEEKYEQIRDEITDFVDNFKEDLKEKYNQKYKGYVDQLDGLKMPVNKFISLMYISQFLNLFIPFAGVICPLIMWNSKKNQDFFIHAHGRNIFNWMFSAIIYSLIIIGIVIALFAIFSFSDLTRLILLGLSVFLLFGILFCSLLFTIIGAWRAYQKKLFSYPFTIAFIK